MFGTSIYDTKAKAGNNGNWQLLQLPQLDRVPPQEGKGPGKKGFAVVGMLRRSSISPF
jgi:hypothetical protein